MKNKNSLTLLASAIGSLSLLSGCASIDRQDTRHSNIQKEIVKTVTVEEESLEAIKTKEQVIVPQLDLNPIGVKKEVRFNLLVNKAPIGAVLRSLVDGTSYSLITPEELNGTISLNLKNVTAFNVLETLKNVYHYDYEVQDKTIIV